MSWYKNVKLPKIKPSALKLSLWSSVDWMMEVTLDWMSWTERATDHVLGGRNRCPPRSKSSLKRQSVSWASWNRMRTSKTWKWWRSGEEHSGRRSIISSGRVAGGSHRLTDSNLNAYPLLLHQKWLASSVSKYGREFRGNQLIIWKTWMFRDDRERGEENETTWIVLRQLMKSRLLDIFL